MIFTISFKYLKLNHYIMGINSIHCNMRSKCLVFIDGFKYNKFKVYNSGHVVWRCFIKSCNSPVTIGSETKNVVKTNNVFKHELLETIKIQI